MEGNDVFTPYDEVHETFDSMGLKENLLKGEVEENDGVLLAHSKNKKRKASLDLNRKHGEKRQNKYYWPKIDVRKPHTPKPPKTPKQITPKPKRKSQGKKVVDCSLVAEQTFDNATTNSSCKQVLGFENDMLTNIDLDFGIDSLTSEDVEKVTEESCDVTEQVPEEIITTCMQGSLDDDKMIKTSEPEVLKVYRRHYSKCIYQCRKLGLSVSKDWKKKKSPRNKKSIQALEKFKGFSCISICEDVLDRIIIMQGKRRMLMPKVKIVREFFKCVMSLLSSRPIVLPKKKRSKQSRRLNHVYRKPLSLQSKASSIMSPMSSPTRQCSNNGNDEHISHRQFDCNVDLIEHKNGTVVEPAVDFEKDEVHICTQQSQTDDHDRSAQLVNACSTASDSQRSKEKIKEEKKASKEKKVPKVPKGIRITRNEKKVPKGKTKVTTNKKLKGKHQDYLSTLTDWRDASLEQIMDRFAQHFGSLRIWTDPKTWSIVVCQPENRGDGFEDSNNEEARLEEEKADLRQKIERFLRYTEFFQGRKRFVKWKGSVLDSVVGVFLTQNVSDVLSSNSFMGLASGYPIEPLNDVKHEVYHESLLEICSSQGSSETVSSSQNVIVEYPEEDEEDTNSVNEEAESSKEFDAALNEMLTSLPFVLEKNNAKGKQIDGAEKIDWEAIRVLFSKKSHERKLDAQDSVDWEAVRKAPVNDIANIIKQRGQHRVIAGKIQKTLNRLVDEHGSLDLEWLREAPPQVAKAYLLSFYGIGLKSVECLRLLTLGHHGFPVDVNIGRIAIRLGWVPIKPLPAELPFHHLQKYPLENEIQQYLWPRLSHLNQEELYEIHYQMITFGKVFCLKAKPNCGACPLKRECKYYASMEKSNRPRLTWRQEQMMIKAKTSKKNKNVPNPFDVKRISLTCMSQTSNLIAYPGFARLDLKVKSGSELSTTYPIIIRQPEYIVEHPPESPQLEEKDLQIPEIEDMGDYVSSKANGEYILYLHTEDDKEVCHNSSKENNVRLQNGDSSSALISLSPHMASKRVPKHVSRLCTAHQVYVLPENHLLLRYLHLDAKIGVMPYLLATWTIGSDDSSMVRGTLLIPAQTAMRGYFPLNGTYFQVNEVFADDETSRHPINVPRSWLWQQATRTLYCGSSTSAIVRGLNERDIQKCCREGYICVRGFNRQTRAPMLLPSIFHERHQAKGKLQQDNKDEDV